MRIFKERRNFEFGIWDFATLGLGFWEAAADEVSYELKNFEALLPTYEAGSR